MKNERPDSIDTEGKAVPPYEGRRQAASASGREEMPARGGAKTGGATGPVEDEEMKAADPESTPGGATESPADEKTARRRKRSRSDDEGTGPAHQRGAPRAEDQS
ncbi:hypothetical protein OG552_31705 [Streptomyces sp. NBC_01476]|uniref:hypothetical protein n=1 Tax=Streptomyces sp. NBC_01476 TaxID=2903881 RepID=UPI002E35CA13|nr:hypothetical protein [Streptomyces sp. NBC_01476]